MKAMMMGGLALALAGVLGCVPQQQQQQPQYAQPQYGQPQYGPQPGQPQYGAPQPGQPQAGQPVPQNRQVSFNGRAATPQDWQIIQQLEQHYGKQLPSGAYWYDPMTGASGMWGGPTVGFVQAGLQLGGPLPANASGGGTGMLTGTFINGREIHPQDRAALMQMLGNVLQGRFWVDAQGNAGQEGGPAQFNLFQIAQQRQAASGGKGGDSIYRTDGRGNNVFVGQGCVAVNAKKGSASSDYYVGCE